MKTRIYICALAALFMIPLAVTAQTKKKQGGKERENLSTLARSCAGIGSALVTVITMQCVYFLRKRQ